MGFIWLTSMVFLLLWSLFVWGCSVSIVGNGSYMFNTFLSGVVASMGGNANDIKITFIVGVLSVNLVSLLSNGDNIVNSIEVSAFIGVSLGLGVLLVNLYYENGSLINMIIPDNMSLLILWMIIAIEIMGWIGSIATMSISFTGNMFGGEIMGNVIGNFGLSGLSHFNILTTFLGWILSSMEMGMEFMVCIIQGYVISMISSSIMEEGEVNKNCSS